MRKQRGCFSALVLLMSLRLLATGDSLHYLLPTDSLVLQMDYGGELVFEHQIEPGQTLYSLSKFYGMQLVEMYAYNPQLRVQNYNNGDMIRIPLPAKALTYKEMPRWMQKRYAPVFYRIRKGDTLYGICKRNFPGISSDTLHLQNPELEQGLKPGKVLFIGWLTLEGVPKELRAEMGPGGRQNYLNKLTYYRKLGKRKEKENKGAAFWEKKSTEDGGLYALHRHAREGSYVKVHNPMSRVTLFLKVIGRLPETAYDPDTVVVVSPRAAKLLNGRDRRFYVRVGYY